MIKDFKIFESRTVSNILDIANKFNNLADELEPLVIKRNNEIAENFDLSQDIVDIYGSDSHCIIHSYNSAKIIGIKMHDNKIFFTLEFYDYDDKYIFYIPFTKKELEKALMEFDASKYNL
jgi:hypothetical protein